MDARIALDTLNRLEVAYPRMTPDGYRASRPIELVLVEKGELGRGTHARYTPNARVITIAGLDQMTDAFAVDTIAHEYAHGVLDVAAHDCRRFRSTAGHCSHFQAAYKEALRHVKA